MKQHREIEKKYTVGERAGCLETVEALIYRLFPTAKRESGTDVDTYFQSPSSDFIRLRHRSGGACELTTKLTDRGSTADRLEINLSISRYEDAYAYLKLIHGLPLGEVTKVYTTFSLPAGEIAVYRVSGDPRTFLEVEAVNQAVVSQTAQVLSQELPLCPEEKSIYQMFIQKPEIDTGNNCDVI